MRITFICIIIELENYFLVNKSNDIHNMREKNKIQFINNKLIN